jgi:uncharacterized membrane protein
MILNFGYIGDIIIFCISFIILTIYFIHFDKNFKKEKIINILGIIILSVFMFMIAKIPLNYFIIFKSSNQLSETKYCTIKNYNSRPFGKIWFEFEKEKYGVTYKKEENMSMKNLINEHVLIIYIKPSVFNTFVLSDYQVTKKKIIPE